MCMLVLHMRIHYLVLFGNDLLRSCGFFYHFSWRETNAHQTQWSSVYMIGWRFHFDTYSHNFPSDYQIQVDLASIDRHHSCSIQISAKWKILLQFYVFCLIRISVVYMQRIIENIRRFVKQEFYSTLWAKSTDAVLISTQRSKKNERRIEKWPIMDVDSFLSINQMVSTRRQQNQWWVYMYIFVLSFTDGSVELLVEIWTKPNILCELCRLWSENIQSTQINAEMKSIVSDDRCLRKHGYQYIL